MHCVEVTPWMSQQPDCPEVVQIPEEETGKPMDFVDVEQGTGSEGISTDLMREPSLASRRLIPAPDSPPPSI